MSEPYKPPVGSIGWCDLTVPQADDGTPTTGG